MVDHEDGLMTLSYRRKRHEEGTRDFAVFDDGTYLGDAIPMFIVHGRPVRKHRDLTPLHMPAHWLAHPAGESHPICPDDDPRYVRLEWATRADAAQALKLRRAGWTAPQLMGLEERPGTAPIAAAHA
jgi:hypothetical protein